MQGPTDWNFTTEPEPGCAGRRLAQPRGKVLGGTSAMNAMVWVRGSRRDFDDWSIPGWGWNDVEPIYQRIEDHYLGAPAHGLGGPMHVTRVAEPDPVARSFVAAARAFGIAANDDVGGPDLDGAAISPVTICRGRRWSTARGYLDTARSRHNFTIVTHAHATRLIISGGRVAGVEFSHRGRTRKIITRREVVLSAGAFGTPHLLQVSGIGPREHLRTVGIEPVVDSPRVGSGLADHPATYMNWELATGFTGLFDARHPRWLAQWLLRGTGKLSSNFMEAVAHVRTRQGLSDPDFQLINGPAYVWDFGRGQHPRPAAAILQSFWAPESRGSVMARSPDARDAPAIQMNTLTAAGDVEAFVRAIRMTQQIAATQPLASVLGREIHPGPEVITDEALAQWIRETCGTTGHPACTAAMGTSEDSVLDERLRVRGVTRLRVADASALPRIPHANTNAPAILIGERCADFIKAERPQPTKVTPEEAS
jgi:choline dehydrogenase